MGASPRRRMGARARRPLLVLAVAVSLVVAACGSSTPSPAASAGGSDAATQGSSASLPTPSAGGPSSTAAIGPGGTGSGWSLAAIEQPAAVGAAASGAAPGLFCSPCHSTVTTYVDAVEPGGPGLVAVGLVFPGTYAAAWTSVDGLTWRRTPDLGAPGTRAFALASGRGGLVAVGDQGHVPAAWWSADGQAWHAGRSPAVPAAGSGQLLAITGSPDGYVAGGWLQEPDGRSSAALWTSPDGRTWTSEVPLPAGSGGQVHGLASDASAEVAVGVGSVDAAGAVASDRAAAWVSTDGRTWRSATIDGSDGARMEAVIVTPAGWLAVGSRDGGMSAASWTSVDGLTWRAAPESPALRNLGGSVRMLGVAAEGTGYIAVGWRDSVGNGNAVAWTSPDGSTWARMTDDDSFSGGGMAAVTSHDGRVVAVGTVGWPDDHFATIWVHAVSGG